MFQAINRRVELVSLPRSEEELSEMPRSINISSLRDEGAYPLGHFERLNSPRNAIGLPSGITKVIPTV